MNLRKEIDRTIREANEDGVNAALAVCVLLESTLGLSVEGWFANDPVMQEALKTMDAPEPIKAAS
ncbi:hypothetical protein JVX91_14510 [Pseudomonas sp. PDNC002]|uniref:hypothetical protein n=1 Tax=Pseudomonas sp. PDNC002 TaxID=2811422 RepID=UPI0019626D4E|nr:hypothetical protein [Pseudomonas sp. PDNC002]QRY82254.1 hypothetical protein JVX91_14510 [Pseudomonas sp. PDNC002]